MSIPYIITPLSVTIYLDGTTHVLSEDSHENYKEIREAVRVKDFETVKTLISQPIDDLIKLGSGRVTVRNGVATIDDRQVPSRLQDRLILLLEEGFDTQPLVLFIENLMNNPSMRAVDELYSWMEACDMPITEDGYLLAYKRVRNNYRDIYTGKIDNSVGQICVMPRNAVDEDKNRTCSAGLHFCSMSYLPSFSYHGQDDRVVILKINPADVVAIPSDYRNAKGRTCRYEVIGEVPLTDLKFYEKSVHTWGDEEHDYDDECEFCGYTLDSCMCDTMDDTLDDTAATSDASGSDPVIDTPSTVDPLVDHSDQSFGGCKCTTCVKPNFFGYETQKDMNYAIFGLMQAVAALEDGESYPISLAMKLVTNELFNQLVENGSIIVTEDGKGVRAD